MQEPENSLRSGALTAVVAALGGEGELLKFQDKDRDPRLELQELKAELDRDISNEVAYLRDAGVVSTETFSDETVMVRLNPEMSDEASEMKELMYQRFNDSLKSLSHSEEYMKFEAPDEWPVWEGPDRSELAEGSIDYSKNLGPLCAVMSMYGEERLQGADLTEYSVDAMEDSFSLDDYELQLDLEDHLETLERLGYVEKRFTGLNSVYRLADDEEVKLDAEIIAQHRDEVFSGYPQNMALAYEEADRQELAEKGVKLVQRPEAQ